MNIFAKGSTYVFKTCDKVIIFFMLINLHLFIFYIEKKIAKYGHSGGAVDDDVKCSHHHFFSRKYKKV